MSNELELIMICNYIETNLAEGVYTDRRVQADPVAIILRHRLDTFLPEISMVMPDMLLGYCSVCSCGSPKMALIMLHTILKENQSIITDAIKNGCMVDNRVLKAVKIRSSHKHPIRTDKKISNKYDKKWAEQKNPDGSNKIDTESYWLSVLNYV